MKRRLAAAPALLLLAGISVAANVYVGAKGWRLYYGDAEAHLNIGRRVLDSRTPNGEQFGTVWLPALHTLMQPLVIHDGLWQSGLAGSLFASACFVLGCWLLYLTFRRVFDSEAAGWIAALAPGLNPNLVYLQATPMTEAVFLAGFAALLYGLVVTEQDQSWTGLAIAAAGSLLASLTRYEGWFLIPFAALVLLVRSERQRGRRTAAFVILASLGPASWLAHNWWYWRDPLEFYRGEWSAMAIYSRQLAAGMQPYPGDHNLPVAARYYWEAARSVSEWGVLVSATAGLFALWRRWHWSIAWLAIPSLFYVWSIYSSGTPIFVPQLWPHSYYNTRYGLAILPLLAGLTAALVSAAPRRWRAAAAATVAAAGMIPWLLNPAPDAWICWKESQVNSEVRRAWTREAARFLKGHYRLGTGIWMPFGDLTGILREAGIPLREALHEGNRPEFDSTLARPELFLRQEWVIAFSGDKVATALQKARRKGLVYSCWKRIEPKGGPVVEIYRRGG
ncbi:MAG: glycosyltransferase family 39 protein [Bryobacteraceae bacterium]|nr:glycosyltransferase family 39 protein [Bryobacteraceae bacterium]